MNVAVTGGTGFIGRHVVAELERRGVSPTIVCRPNSSAPAAFARHTIVRMDLSAPPPDAFDVMHQPDTLIHLAWGGLPQYGSSHHVQTELPAQYAFLKQLVEEGLGNCLVTGTCFEYGDASGALSESLATCPKNPYGVAKDSLRRQLEALQRQAPFNLTWARLFYLYGDGQAAGSLLPELRRAVERGDRDFGLSPGDQIRDYLPVETAAAHLVSLAMSGRNNGVVNVCSGSPVSVRQLVEGWVEQYGWSISLRFGERPYSSYEPMAFWGDASKLHHVLAD